MSKKENPTKEKPTKRRSGTEALIHAGYIPVAVDLTLEQYEVIERAAELKGLSMGMFIAAAVMPTPTSSQQAVPQE